MEHKLIQGGEQFLPFARSRIKALRATGLLYASQQFEVDGVSIKVRIEGEHEYIELAGSGYKLLSGVVKNGEVITLPVPPGSPEGTPPRKTLRSFKATTNTWETALKKNPEKPLASFNDEDFLANAGNQYRDLRPSMFSGLMAKAVSILMGIGAEIKYAFQASRCHGVTLDNEDKPWVVEISSTNGVLAMPMGIAGRPSKSNSNLGARESRRLFGGIPDGVEFPTGTELSVALLTGRVLRLADASDLQPFYSKYRYVDIQGWSFDQTGRECRHTCYSLSPATTGFMYKIDISIIAATPNDEASGAATLTLMESGPLERTSGMKVPFCWVYPNGVVVVLPMTIVATWSPVARTTPIHVTHDGSAWDVVRVVYQVAGTVVTGTTQSESPTGWSWTSTLSDNYPYVSSDRLPDKRLTGTQYNNGYFTVRQRYPSTTHWLYYGTGASASGSTSIRWRCGLATTECRDGYVMRYEPEQQVDRTVAAVGEWIGYTEMGSDADPFPPTPPPWPTPPPVTGPPPAVIVSSRPRPITRVLGPLGLDYSYTDLSLSENAATAEQILWETPELTLTHPRFVMHSSTLGVLNQSTVVFTRYLGNAEKVLVGNAFRLEPPPTVPQTTFTFIGYSS